MPLLLWLLAARKKKLQSLHPHPLLHLHLLLHQLLLKPLLALHLLPHRRSAPQVLRLMRPKMLQALPKMPQTLPKKLPTLPP